MKINQPTLFLYCVLLGLSFSGSAEIQDQGLNSILLIMDKAISEISSGPESAIDEDPEEAAITAAALETASAAVVNLSRTLGTLSYSRLQCGEAGVLSEFTQRVQQMPEQSRDPMRDAFQEGFDKSKNETKLLSEDECKRLTQSRIRTEKVEESNVEQELKPAEVKKQEVVEEKPDEAPKLKFLRIAEISGQLAFKTEICQSKRVFTRDYNEFIETVPEEYQEEVKTAYWKGYTHGKRLNKNLTLDQC
jgi:predicted secreted protein